MWTCVGSGLVGGAGAAGFILGQLGSQGFVSPGKSGLINSSSSSSAFCASISLLATRSSDSKKWRDHSLPAAGSPTQLVPTGLFGVAPPGPAMQDTDNAKSF